MTSTFFALQHVHLGIELGVRSDTLGSCHYHAALHIGAFHTAQKQTGIVTRHTFIQGLVEHFHTSDHGGHGFFAQADDFHIVTYVHLTAINTAGHHGAAPLDGEDIFHWHHEGFVYFTNRVGEVAVNSIQQLLDAGILGRIGVSGSGFQGFEGAAADNGNGVPGEVVGG